MAKRRKKTTSEISDSSCRAARQKLPSGLKAQFGSIGFVKWTCAYSPVLIVDPIKMVLSQSIPEGIYNAWMHQVHLHSSIDDEDDDNDDSSDVGYHDDFIVGEKGKNRGSDDEASIQMLPVLVYWYGTNYEFSIVRLSQIIPWEEGCQKGYHILPPFMSRRIQKLRRPVPAVYSLLEDALIKVEQDGLPHPPEGRSLAIFPPGNKKKTSVVLNEWHALAMEAPPQEHSWMEQKQRMEPALPRSKLFGQIAFLANKCGPLDYYHPVLVMHPFRVPPNHRTEWFNKCSSGKLVMVYWMGSYTSGRIQQHVFTCHPVADLVPYHVGVKKKYDKIPKQIMQDYGKTNLSAKRMAQIDFWVCGTDWELPRALERKPQDRWGGLEDFEEDHDDDFDYFWECLNAAKEARAARREQRKNNGSSTTTKRGKHDEASNRQQRKSHAVVDDSDDEEEKDDWSHDDDDDDTSNNLDDNMGLFDDSSVESSDSEKDDGGGKDNDDNAGDDDDDDDYDQPQVASPQAKKRKIAHETSKSSSAKERSKPTHAKRLESSSRRSKFVLREGEEGNGDKDMNGTQQQPSLQEELDHAVRRSLSHVAAILKEGTTEARPGNAKSTTTDSNHKDFLPRIQNGATVSPNNSKSSDFMRELNRQRQAAATEKVVNDVIEQWTHVRHAKK